VKENVFDQIGNLSLMMLINRMESNPDEVIQELMKSDGIQSICGIVAKILDDETCPGQKLIKLVCTRNGKWDKSDRGVFIRISNEQLSEISTEVSDFFIGDQAMATLRPPYTYDKETKELYCYVYDIKEGTGQAREDGKILECDEWDREQVEKKKRAAEKRGKSISDKKEEEKQEQVSQNKKAQEKGEDSILEKKESRLGLSENKKNLDVPLSEEEEKQAKKLAKQSIWCTVIAWSTCIIPFVGSLVAIVGISLSKKSRKIRKMKRTMVALIISISCLLINVLSSIVMFLPESESVATDTQKERMSSGETKAEIVAVESTQESDAPADTQKENMAVEETKAEIETVESTQESSMAGLGETDAESQSEAVVQTENPFEQFKDYPTLSEEYVRYYLYAGKIPFPDFSKYFSKMAKDTENVETEQMYVYKAGWGNDEAYKKSPDISDYIYSGEVKDGQPHGLGVVYYVINNYFQIPDPIYQKVYEGYFEKGKCSEFGISYIPAFRDADGDEVFIEIEQNHNAQYHEAIHLYYNPIQYIGEYDKGSRKGVGVRFDLPVDEQDAYIKGGYTLQDAVIQIGTFKDGEIVKEGQIYVNEFRQYEGEMKDGKKHGKGVLYYRNRKQVAFKGTFKEDEVSEGTLYDLDGTVICEGEWSNGLCGLTDFYDVYYSNSIMEEQDYKVLLGDEYDDYASMKELLSDTELTMEEDASGSADEYILPDSDKRYLDMEDLYGLDVASLRLARNEIFARHGRLFQAEDLNTYFSSQSWYNGYLAEEEFDDSVLNEFERKNLELIQAAEQELQ